MLFRLDEALRDCQPNQIDNIATDTQIGHPDEETLQQITDIESEGDIQPGEMEEDLTGDESLSEWIRANTPSHAP